MKKYECPCGYIYDPAIGDPDSGIAPGTAFEDIPDSWVCPVCGLGKDAFYEIDGPADAEQHTGGPAAPLRERRGRLRFSAAGLFWA